MIWLTLALAAPCTFDDSEPTAWLVTFTPGQDITTAFGHSALLVHEPDLAGESRMYDFGHFDHRSLSFVWNFLNADQDYWLARTTLDRMVTSYNRRGRPGIAQRLALNPGEVVALEDGLNHEARRENREFRYNWFGPNCSTRIADRIDDAVGGQMRPQHQELLDTSARHEVLRHTQDGPVWFGLNWGSGRRASEPITRWQAAFMPDRLMEAATDTQLATGPLVTHTCDLTTGPSPWPRKQSPARTLPLAIAGFTVGSAMAAASRVPTLLFTGLFLWGLFWGVFGSAALLVGVLGTFAPHWGHHNLAFASPLTFLVPIALLLRWRRPQSALPTYLLGAVAGVSLLGLLYTAVSGNADHNLGIAALLVPGWLAALLYVRPTTSSGSGAPS